MPLTRRHASPQWKPRTVPFERAIVVPRKVADFLLRPREASRVLNQVGVQLGRSGLLRTGDNHGWQIPIRTRSLPNRGRNSRLGGFRHLPTRANRGMALKLARIESQR